MIKIAILVNCLCPERAAVFQTADIAIPEPVKETCNLGGVLPERPAVFMVRTKRVSKCWTRKQVKVRSEGIIAIEGKHKLFLSKVPVSLSAAQVCVCQALVDECMSVNSSQVFEATRTRWRRGYCCLQ